MGFFTWIILGLIAGVLAKWLMPGKDGGGMIVTILLGIAGAFVVGWFAALLGFGSADGFNIPSIITATLGALLLLFVYRQVQK